MVKIFASIAKKGFSLDIPNDRSSHTVPTPRGGGAIIFVVWACSVSILATLDVIDDKLAATLLASSTIISGIGLLDDMKGLKASTRFVAHILASCIVCMQLLNYRQAHLGSLDLKLGLFGPALAVIFMAWSTNLFNFMDGIDGLAGSEGVWTCGVGGYALWHSGATGLALISWSLAAAAGGFLVWNWPKAQIFMGDVGSGFLGFLIAAVALIGDYLYGVSVLVWIIAYGIFCFDASITLVRRIFNQECWYAGHRSHAYQRLHHRLGWSHLSVLKAISTANAVLCILAVWAIYSPKDTFLMLGSAFALISVLYVLVELAAPMFKVATRGPTSSL